jgi:hypothetical protein
VTLVLRVANTGEEAVDADLQLALPDGWRLLVRHDPVRLEPGAASVRILSVFAPQEAPAGEHTVGIAAVDAQTGVTLGTIALRVRVLPYLEMQLDALDGSTLVVAGEEIVLPFRLANRSNTELAVSLDAASRSDYPTSFDGIAEQPVILAAGESRRIVAVVQTPEEVGRVEDHQLMVTATGVPPGSDGEVNANLRATAQIIPLVSEEPAALNTVPARLGLSTSHTFSDEWRGYLNADFAGGGYLDAEGRRRLEFKIAPSLPLHELGFGSPRDVYRANYEGEQLELMLGDNRYAVSPLLGPGLSGRGVLARTTLDRFRLGGLAYYPRSGTLAESTLGALFDYTIPQADDPDEYRYRAAANLLSQPGEFLSFGTHHAYRFAESVAVEGEIALGANAGEAFAPAVMAGASGTVSTVEYAATARFGMPGFPGPYGDRLSLTGTAASYVGSRGARITANALLDRYNLQNSAADEKALRTTSAGLGTRLPLGITGASFTAGLRHRSRTDMADAPSVDTGTSSLTTTTILPLGAFRLGINTSLDAEHDGLADAWMFAQRYSLSASFNRSSGSSYSVTAAVSDRRGERVTTTSSYGLTLGTELSRETVTTSFRTSAELTTRANREPEFSLALSNRTDFRLPRSHLLSLSALLRLVRTSSDRDLSGALTLGYSIPMRVPVSRPEGLGSVVGTVYNEETGEPAGDVVIRMADRAVVTGPEGRFRFSGLPPGEYHLQMDTSRLAGRLIPDLPIPILVTVPPDEATELEIPVIRSARVTGEVMRYAIPGGQEGLLERALTANGGEYEIADLQPAGGLVRAVVELRNGAEVRRVISDRNGRFVFSDLRPGEWTATLPSTQMPRFHRLVQEEFTLNVAPGGTAHLTFQVAPMRRPVTLLPSSAAPLELTLDPPAEPEPEPPPVETPPEEDREQAPPRSSRLLVMAVERYAQADPRSPQLLGLRWGADRPTVAASLSRRPQPLDLSGEFEQRPFIAEYGTDGVVLLARAGTARLTFLDPLSDQSQLFLSAVEVRIDGERTGLSPDELESTFEELLGLSIARWRPTEVRDEQHQGRRSVVFDIADVRISFVLDAREGFVSVEYAHRWHRDAIRDILETDTGEP